MSPEVNPEGLDDKELVGADPAEVGARRAGMRENAVDGAGQGDGRPKGSLASAPDGPSADAAASRRAGAMSGPNSDTNAEAGKQSGREVGRNTVKAALGNKKALFSLLTGGGIIGIIIFVFLALLPLKLEGLMKNILEKRVTNKVEYMMERRTDMLVKGYLERQLGLGAGRGLVVEQGLVKTLYGNWRKNKFETKFMDESGYKLEKCGRGCVKLSNPDGSHPESFKDANSFDTYLGENRGLNARSFIRQVTRQQTQWHQVVKRRNMRRFMRNAYGITKWSFFTGKKGKEAETEVAGRLEGDAAGRYEPDVTRTMDCALSDQNCPSDHGPIDQPEGAPSTTSSSSAKPGDSQAASDSSGAVKKAINRAKQLAPSEIAKKGLAKILEQFMGEELAKTFANKAIPIVGQILLFDQAARVDHFFHSGKADDALRSIHKVQYAAEFAQFLSIDDNMKDPQHKMSADEVNAVMTRLGDVGKSAAFQDVFMNKQGGEKIAPSLGINDTAYPIRADYNQYFPPASALSGPLQLWYTEVDNHSVPRYLIDKINEAAGAIGGAAFSVLESIPGVGSLIKDGGKLLAEQLVKLVPPAVTGVETGAALFNGIDAGGAVTGQDFARSLGGHEMSPTASLDMQQAIALNKTANEGAPSLRDQFFSTDKSNSVINQIAYSMPSSFGDAVQQSANYSLAVVKNPFSFFGSVLNWHPSLAYADSNYNLYGLKDYGATEAELNQPIDQAGLDAAVKKAAARKNASPDTIAPNDIEPSDCPDVSPDKLNLCRLDLQTIQSLNAMYTQADDGGLGGAAASAPSSNTGVVSGNAQQLAKEILANHKVDLGGRLVRQDVEAAAAGKPGSAGTPLSATVLQIIATVGQSHSVYISALESGGTGHASGSYHYRGQAVDFAMLDGRASTGRDAGSLEIIKLISPLLKPGSGIGQSGCGSSPSLPSGVTTFSDSCNHLHVQVSG